VKQNDLRFDTYDTDAESIDTTVASVAQPGGPQQAGKDVHAQRNEDPAGYNDEEYDEGEGSEEEQEQQYQDYGEQQQFGYVPEDIRKQVFESVNASGPFHIEGDSYPTTTSGFNEHTLTSQDHVDEDQLSDDVESRSHVSPTPQRDMVKGKPLHALGKQGIARPASTGGFTQPTQGNHGLYQQQVAPENVGQNFPWQPPQASRRTNSDPRFALPPNQIQTTHPVTANTAKDTGASQMNNKPSMQTLPQRVPGARPRAFGVVPSSNHLVHVQPKAIPVRKPAIDPAPNVPPFEADNDQNIRPETPDEDYEIPALYNMSYDDLKVENFDADPRRRDPVLSRDMATKPLNDRLDHVQKNLAPADQTKFFRSLPTREWEDAGDWFLSQFESIIKRTREARQEKRKLAREFEKEVEKRHRHVAKKSRQVDDALQKMSAQGQGLLPPKSPTPARR
jgi:hypothetical protein